jgi:hypothetical protein
MRSLSIVTAVGHLLTGLVFPFGVREEKEFGIGAHFRFGDLSHGTESRARNTGFGTDILA